MLAEEVNLVTDVGRLSISSKLKLKAYNMTI